jgi:hypothetical protein
MVNEVMVDRLKPLPYALVLLRAWPTCRRGHGAGTRQGCRLQPAVSLSSPTD